MVYKPSPGEHACETYAYPRDSHGFPSSLHMHLSHLPSLLGVLGGRFCSLLQFELSLRVAVGSCRCIFGLLGYGRPPDLDAKESGGSGGSFVAVREPPRRHGHINRSVCINVSVACIPCCILSCGGMCKEARTHDRRVWAGWLRACQLAHFRCARGP